MHIKALTVLIALLTGLTALAQNGDASEIIRDDFDDGSITDGNPVRWSNPQLTLLTLFAPRLTIRASGGGAGIVSADRSNSTGWSMRAEVSRKRGDFTGVGSLGPGNSWALIDGNGGLQVGTGEETLERLGDDFDPEMQSYILQLDTLDNQLRAWAWPADSLPDSVEPMAAADFTTTPNGRPSMWVRDFSGVDGGEAESSFAWFEFSEQPLPIPVADCSGDGTINEGDLICVSAIAARDAVLESLGSLPGDLDGDREIAFGDFLILSQHFGEAGGYADGNINLVGIVDFADFLTLSRNFGQRPQVAAVPEPSACAVLPACLFGVLLLRPYRER